MGNGFAFKTYPASANHPAVFRFAPSNIITPGPGFNAPLDPEDLPSCATPFLGVAPMYSFGGALKVSNGLSGSAVFAHDGANGIIDVQGLSSNTNAGSLLINYYCHRSVAICTGASTNPSENKVYIGDFLNARKHVEIGSPTSPLDAANSSLDIFTNSGKGINFTTYNNAMPLINVANSNFATSPFTVLGDGRAYFGTKRIQSSHIHANAEFQVWGKIACKELVVVDPTKWADFVFDNNYKLPTLTEVETYYKTNKHLKDVPSEAEVKQNGINTADMYAVLLQKVEELTLYTVEQNKRIVKLEAENKKLQQTKH